MPPLAKKFLWAFIIFLIFNLGVSVWFFFHDLDTRFPNMDWENAQFGVVSWYSEKDKHINEKTANGEIFDDKAMTCASWDYPFGEKLIIINPFSGKWVVCRVNDRGPAKRLNRKIDLTKSAFKRVANLRKGLLYASIIRIEKTTQNPS